MFCHICGTQISDGASFCHKCGTKAAYTGAAQQASIVSGESFGAEKINASMVKKDTVQKENISAEAALQSMSGGNKASLACILIGFVGFFGGGILMPSSSGGGVVSAERHMANLAQLDIALQVMIGGFLLWVIGALIMIISSRKKK